MNFAGWMRRGLLSAGLTLAMLPGVLGQSQPAQAQSQPAAQAQSQPAVAVSAAAADPAAGPL